MEKDMVCQVPEALVEAFECNKHKEQLLALDKTRLLCWADNLENYTQGNCSAAMKWFYPLIKPRLYCTIYA